MKNGVPKRTSACTDPMLQTRLYIIYDNPSKKISKINHIERMKSLLIVFIVLLFLLTLLSSFGGSIKTSEPFYDGNPAFQPTALPSFDIPHPAKFDTFEKKKEGFYEDAAATGPVVPSLVPENPQSGSSQPVQTTEEPFYNNEKVEKFRNIEKFEIPEPFADADSQVGAPF